MKSKITDRIFQMIIQNNMKPEFKHAVEAWDIVRLQLQDSVEVKVLDNFFKK